MAQAGASAIKSMANHSPCCVEEEKGKLSTITWVLVFSIAPETSNLLKDLRNPEIRYVYTNGGMCTV